MWMIFLSLDSSLKFFYIDLNSEMFANYFIICEVGQRGVSL